MQKATIYKSQASQRAVTAWIDQRLLALDATSQIVETRMGLTHVLTTGAPTAPPLLLLPGTNFSALAWAPYFPLLRDQFYLIAVDTLGQPGKSASYRFPFKGDAYAQWLESLLEVLNVGRAHVAGHSLGGWLALHLAGTRPACVNRLVLLDPAGLIPLRLTGQLIGRSLPLLWKPTPAQVRSLLATMTTQPPSDTMVEWMTLVVRSVQSSLAPPALPPKQLRQIKAPTLLLSGEKDVFLPPKKLARIARKYLSNITVEIVPDAGHLLPEEQPAFVSRRLATFLSAPS
ncbi:Pimeloyl-ACP methyl ester carboxylesterase [Catalinimonas alkaloidigena]|uniref:Pimeloyl-ACP methyl ester carboxylesterase n=1 Tax=Catalinimonas alkaloidigena TaxID=1075417 RepID=A0A1G9T955_9BACT|nr:alpha/beta hydrolase [Catalinimonas alkaloidigena]SDM44217.1 Pimeloyl-ACP methyl ester carboxylesterase [Catalinimonas alkaloidigena]